MLAAYLSQGIILFFYLHHPSSKALGESHARSMSVYNHSNVIWIPVSRRFLYIFWAFWMYLIKEKPNTNADADNGDDNSSIIQPWALFLWLLRHAFSYDSFRVERENNLAFELIHYFIWSVRYPSLNLKPMPTPAKTLLIEASSAPVFPVSWLHCTVSIATHPESSAATLLYPH